MTTKDIYRLPGDNRIPKIMTAPGGSYNPEPPFSKADTGRNRENYMPDSGNEQLGGYVGSLKKRMFDTARKISAGQATIDDYLGFETLSADYEHLDRFSRGENIKTAKPARSAIFSTPQKYRQGDTKFTWDVIRERIENSLEWFNPGSGYVNYYAQPIEWSPTETWEKIKNSPEIKAVDEKYAYEGYALDDFSAQIMYGVPTSQIGAQKAADYAEAESAYLDRRHREAEKETGHEVMTKEEYDSEIADIKAQIAAEEARSYNPVSTQTAVAAASSGIPITFGEESSETVKALQLSLYELELERQQLYGIRVDFDVQSAAAYDGVKGTVKGWTADTLQGGMQLTKFAVDAYLRDAAMTQGGDIANYEEWKSPVKDWIEEKSGYLEGVQSDAQAAQSRWIESTNTKIGRFGQELLITGIQMGLDAVTGKGTASLFLRTTGSSSHEARQFAAANGLNVSELQISGYALTRAFTEVMTEKLFDGAARVYGVGAADEIVDELAAGMASSPAARKVIVCLMNSTGEGIEEVISALAEPFERAILTGEINLSYDPAAIGHDFMLGAAMGLGIGAGQLALDSDANAGNSENTVTESRENSAVKPAENTADAKAQAPGAVESETDSTESRPSAVDAYKSSPDSTSEGIANVDAFSAEVHEAAAKLEESGSDAAKNAANIGVLTSKAIDGESFIKALAEENRNDAKGEIFGEHSEAANEATSELCAKLDEKLGDFLTEKYGDSESINEQFYGGVMNNPTARKTVIALADSGNISAFTEGFAENLRTAIESGNADLSKTNGETVIGNALIGMAGELCDTDSVRKNTKSEKGEIIVNSVENILGKLQSVQLENLQTLLEESKATIGNMFKSGYSVQASLKEILENQINGGKTQKMIAYLQKHNLLASSLQELGKAAKSAVRRGIIINRESLMLFSENFLQSTAMHDVNLDNSGLRALGSNNLAFSLSVEYNNDSSDTNVESQWRQSEKMVRTLFPMLTSQQSFINGEVTYNGAKGSVRPDQANEILAIEVKNYNVDTLGGRNSLVGVIRKQFLQRLANLPSGTQQCFVLDLRGKNYSDIDSLCDRIAKTTYNRAIIIVLESESDGRI